MPIGVVRRPVVVDEIVAAEHASEVRVRTIDTRVDDGDRHARAAFAVPSLWEVHRFAQIALVAPERRVIGLRVLKSVGGDVGNRRVGQQRTTFVVTTTLDGDGDPASCQRVGVTTGDLGGTVGENTRCRPRPTGGVRPELYEQRPRGSAARWVTRNPANVTEAHFR